MGNLSTSAAHVINMFGFHLSMRQSVKTPGRLLRCGGYNKHCDR